MTSTSRTTELRFQPQEIDRKWQERWERDAIYRVRDDDPRPKWYELTMYPYPSGDLHVGHWYTLAPSDAHARFRRMQGYNVLHPMGFDAFGLPAENAAIKRGIHPYNWTMDKLGATCSPSLCMVQLYADAAAGASGSATISVGLPVYAADVPPATVAVHVDAFGALALSSAAYPSCSSSGCAAKTTLRRVQTAGGAVQRDSRVVAL